MKAIIIDDEPKAIDLLRKYLRHFDHIQLAGTFRNALKAMAFLNEETVDVVFLDINMPHLNGVTFSRTLPSDTKVIFTTAHAEYAVESYDVNAVDYLLKPITMGRFANAIAKLGQPAEIPSSESKRILLLKSGSKLFRVPADSVVYLEKESNYMTFYQENEKVVARMTIKEALEILPANFQQVHRSYIVNLDEIDFVDGEGVHINNQLIPVGANYKHELMRHFSE